MKLMECAGTGERRGGGSQEGNANKQFASSKGKNVRDIMGTERCGWSAGETNGSLMGQLVTEWGNLQLMLALTNGGHYSFFICDHYKQRV